MLRRVIRTSTFWLGLAFVGIFIYGFFSKPREYALMGISIVMIIVAIIILINELKKNDS